jgi:hypothetical protein
MKPTIIYQQLSRLTLHVADQRPISHFEILN